MTGSAGLQLRALDASSRARWNAFVAACPQATFFHRAEWGDVIARAFGHPTWYWYAEDADGRIRGVLPLARVRSVLFGDTLTSLPFAVYGGVAADDAAAQELLEARACELATSLGVGCLELRNRQPCHPDWPTKQLYVTFRKAIATDHEANLKAIPRKQRAMVRKGIDAGLEAVATDEPDRFFAVYSESVRNLGTPVFPQRYFRLLTEAFGKDCEMLVVTHEGRDIAAVMSFYFRDEVLPYYGGSRPAARELKGNDFMYWALMRRAVERGARLFDFGRSKEGTGSYSFKKNWGFEPERLHYEYFLVKDRQVPDVNPMNPRYQLFIAGWRRLPLPLANVLGARLSPYLG